MRFNLLLLHPNEHSQELHYYYPFEVKLDGCVGSCNTLMTYLVEYVFKVMQKNKIYKFLVWLQEKWIKNCKKTFIIWL